GLSMARATCLHSLRTIGGQQLGMLPAASQEALLGRAWLQAHEKGGRPFALACWLGAESVGAPEAVATGLEEFGMVIGEAVQAIDDGMDVLKAAPRELTNIGGSLALAYAYGVADAEDLAALQRLECAVREGEEAAPAKMRDKLVGMGAVRYLTIEATARVLRARTLLRHLEGRLVPDGFERLWRVTEWLEPMAELRRA
ncbi:MAG: polyprenyl synthetase family protein, partial [Anaerolineae bacterium]